MQGNTLNPLGVSIVKVNFHSIEIFEQTASFSTNKMFATWNILFKFSDIFSRKEKISSPLGNFDQVEISPEKYHHRWMKCSHSVVLVEVVHPLLFSL